MLPAETLSRELGGWKWTDLRNGRRAQGLSVLELERVFSVEALDSVWIVSSDLFPEVPAKWPAQIVMDDHRALSDVIDNISRYAALNGIVHFLEHCARAT